MRSAARQNLRGASALIVAAVHLVTVAKPLVLYQGDSIVKKAESNGYAWPACAMLKQKVDIDCDTTYSCCAGNSGLVELLPAFKARVIDQAPQVLHFNQGIDVINCLGDGGLVTEQKLSAYQQVLWTVVGMFRNALPASTFIMAASTRADACVKNPYCGDCGRYDANVVRINAMSKEVCDILSIPYADLYKVCVDNDLPTIDGRHFQPSGAAIIGRASADFVLPFINSTDLRVSMSAPRFDTVVSEGSVLRLAATVAGPSAQKVEFYDGDTKLGQDASSPFEFTWPSVPRGYHRVKAKAIAADGTVAWSPMQPVSGLGFPIKVDAGSLVGSDEFLPDRFYSPGAYGLLTGEGWGGYTTGAIRIPGNVDIAGTDLDGIYRTARWGEGCNSGAPFAYRFDVPNGTYHVGLMLVEHWADPGQRLYSITIEGAEAAKLIDPFTSAGGKHTAVLWTQEVQVKDAALDIGLWAKYNHAVVSGIIIDQKAIDPVSLTGRPVHRTTRGETRLLAVVRDGCLTVSTGDARSVNHLEVRDARGALPAACDGTKSIVVVDNALPRGLYVLTALLDDGTRGVARIAVK